METPPTDVRQRSVTLIQETGALLGMIPSLLDRSDELQASVDTMSKQNEDLRKEATTLKSEVNQLRNDREEMADSLTALMNDVLRLATEAVAKLRPPERRSTFWRDSYSPAGDNAQLRPASPSGAPWRKEG